MGFTRRNSRQDNREKYLWYDAMTLKHIDKMLDYLEGLADRHYIDSIERDDDTIAEQIDCKCSEKRLTNMKRRIVRYYEALLRGDIVEY
jgi:hypothetical protein